MPAWKEHHYARAIEFVRLLDAALGSAAQSTPAVAPQPAPTPAPIPTPAAPASPPPPAAKPTAASVFKNIPWKK